MIRIGLGTLLFISRIPAGNPITDRSESRPYLWS